MGIRGFFPWLLRQFPGILSRNLDASGQEVSQDPKEEKAAEPSGCVPARVDNLYLDLNSLVHTALEQSRSADSEKVVQNLLEKLDKIVLAARPRELVYLVLDGPAPRAKLMLQRKRRLAAANGEKEKERLAQQSAQQQQPQSGPKPDSNMVTPGTEFLARISRSLQRYAARRLADPRKYPHWEGLRVLVSDASVPGEGEHKVMSWVRAQRAAREASGAEARDLVHCIYGNDADFILLTLATREPNWFILRDFRDKLQYLSVPRLRKQLLESLRFDLPQQQLEPVAAKPTKPSSDKPEEGKTPEQLRAEKAAAEEEARNLDRAAAWAALLSQPVVGGTAWDEFRALDDWIALCCLVGNDFVPPLFPADPNNFFHATETVESLLRVWRSELRASSSESWISDSGSLDVGRLLVLLKKFLALYPQPEPAPVEPPKAPEKEVVKQPPPPPSAPRNKQAEKNRKKRLRKKLRKQQLNGESPKASAEEPKGVEAKEEVEAEEAKEDEDASPESVDLVRAYLDGLRWTLRYYYGGVPSWGWFYAPGSASPSAQSLADLADSEESAFPEPSWDLGAPLSPLLHLSSVLPHQSFNLLPERLDSQLRLPAWDRFFQRSENSNDVSSSDIDSEIPRLAALLRNLGLDGSAEDSGREFLLVGSDHPSVSQLPEELEPETAISFANSGPDFFGSAQSRSALSDDGVRSFFYAPPVL